MAYEYTSNGRYPHWAGRLFLGRDRNGDMVGIGLGKHLVTVAGSGGGKGVGLIVQNARKWPASLLCLDPKEGENLRLSWKAREALGQTVYAIDPFGFGTKDPATPFDELRDKFGYVPEGENPKRPKAPHRLRARFNPLQEIDLNSKTAATEIRNIADGLVVVHNPEHMEWVEGARDILAGLCAYVMQTAPVEYQSLVTVRNLLMQLDGVPTEKGEMPDGLYAEAIRMTSCIGVGGLSRAAGLAIQTGLTSTKGMEKDFLGGARRATKWLDDEAIQECLSRSTFSLRELKKRPSSVYVVLHPDHLEVHAPLLRLFTQCAMNAMMKDEDTGVECLFILDEAYSLGAMERLKKAFTTTRHYGIHLWLIFQGLGAIDEIYDVEGRETFFTNSDALIFFENGKDSRALDFVARSIGDLKPDEIASGPPRRTPFEPIPQPRPVPFFGAPPPVAAIYNAPPPPTQRSGYTHQRAALSPPGSYQPGPNAKGGEVMIGMMFSGLASLGHSMAVEADNASAARVEQWNRDLAAKEANERAAWQHEVSAGEAKNRAANEDAMRRWQAKNARDEAAHRAGQEEAMRQWHVQNDAERHRHEAAEAEKQARFDFIMQQAYRPRQTPEEIRMLTSKREGEDWCRSMIVFGFANDILNVSLYPYFVEEDDIEKARLDAIRREEQERAAAIARAEQEHRDALERAAQAERDRLAQEAETLRLQEEEARQEAERIAAEQAAAAEVARLARLIVPKEVWKNRSHDYFLDWWLLFMSTRDPEYTSFKVNEAGRISEKFLEISVSYHDRAAAECFADFLKFQDKDKDESDWYYAMHIRQKALAEWSRYLLKFYTENHGFKYRCEFYTKDDDIILEMWTKEESVHPISLFTHCGYDEKTKKFRDSKEKTGCFSRMFG